MRNKSIIARLKEDEKEKEEIVIESIKQTKNKTQIAFYEFWKTHDRNQFIEDMFNDLKRNIDQYWLNEKYNKERDQSFNLLYFEHGGLYGGEYDTFAVNFNYNSTENPIFETMDERFDYLENISGLPGCEIPLLSYLTSEIQGKENDFGDWDDVMDIYNLFESTALIETHHAFFKASNENLFESLNLKKPLYFAVGEHDAGTPKLVYVLE